MQVSQIQELLTRHIADGGFAGGAVIAAQHGEIVIEEYAGLAAPDRPASATTLWPLASISKLYTAAMIMRLVEKGQLTLNTLASHFFPQFTGDGRETIRLRQLLSHTAGMIYESPEMAAQLIAQTPRAALVEEMLAAPLQFTPGSAFDYADYHYLLAGCMAEAATGQDFGELVETLVFAPMGLHDSYMRPPAAVHDRLAQVRAVMAEGTPGAMYNSPHALSLAHPAFGAVTTARDLVRFALHFAPGGPRIHSAATIRTMITDQTINANARASGPFGVTVGTHIPWGIGFALKATTTPSLFADLASTQAYGHGGASGCQLVIDPAADAIVAVLTNTHARSGRERWYMRLQSLLNAAFAVLPE
jgi:CubicO group peptidase (beta-lactamase class C family)